MKYAIPVALGVSLLFLRAVAQDAGKKDGELTDGLEILKKADAAAKAVKSVQYKAVAKGLGADEGRNPAVEGTAVIAGWLGFGPAKYRFDVRVKRPGSSDAAEYVAGTDGDIVYLIDVSKKTVYADMDPAVLGSMGRVVRSILVGKFVNPDAFAEELKAEKVELKGTTEVNGHECYEVSVNYGADGGEGVWYLSKTDFLPRSVDRVFPRPNGEKGGRHVTLTDVVVNPKAPADKDPFALIVPEGFTKTDDFAP